MTEIATYRPRDVASPSEAYQTSAVQRLGEWAHSAQAAHQVASQLVQTSFVPEAFRGKPHEATAAILAGAEVGLSPMSSLRSFDIIQGTAAPRAITLRAIVQSLGHEVIVEESTATRCRVKARRRGSHDWQTVLWTIDRAKQLGLTGKHNWKAQPQAMLAARATSEACRLIAADAILGIGYTAEEVGDGGGPASLEVDTTTGEIQQAGSKRLSRKRPEPEPESGEAEQPTDEPGPEPDTISSSQLKKIGALMREVDLTDRIAALAYVSRVVGRDVASRNDLTKREASDLIDALEADRAALPTGDWGPQNDPEQEDQP